MNFRCRQIDGYLQMLKMLLTEVPRICRLQTFKNIFFNLTFLLDNCFVFKYHPLTERQTWIKYHRRKKMLPKRSELLKKNREATIYLHLNLLAHWIFFCSNCIKRKFYYYNFVATY